MKKILLFAMGALMAMPSMAQEEDVTSYIANPGFDEDLTWAIDGATKEIVKNTVSLSDRSWAYEAADSSIYAKPKETSSQNRSDGLKLQATNGFIGRIKGWTISSNQDYPKCEWVYFGSVPYGLGEQAVPIADDGTTFLAVPAKPADAAGDDNLGALYLRAGWGAWATYKQEVKLPSAEYRLDYWVMNANFEGSKSNINVKNLCQVSFRKKVIPDEDGFNAAEWTKHSITFKATADFTIQFGFQSSGGSGSNPFILIDGIKLYKIGDVDEEEILGDDLSEVQADATNIQGEATAQGLTGLAKEIADYIYEIDEAVNGGDLDEMNSLLKASNDQLAKFTAAIEALSAVQTVTEKMDRILSTTDYPGKSDFLTAYERISGYMVNGTADQLIGAVEEAEAAIRTYYMSQVGSVDNPADYTFLVKNPWFVISAAEPVLQDDMWVFPNASSYTVGSGQGTNTDLTSDGWYQSGGSGGDQRLNFQQGRTCWNAWRSGFTDVIGIAQDLEGLPNGFYKASADMITQSGMITNQHVFVNTPAGKVESPVLTSDQYIDGGEGVWETLTTTDKVLVTDGKITIGAEGKGDGEGAHGWFLVTNFKLYYLGAATDDDLKKAFQDKIDAAELMADTMHFAADKKAYQDSIAKYRGMTENLTEALAAFALAQKDAEASEAKYQEYMMPGKTLPTLKDSLTKEGAYGQAFEIVKFAYDFSNNWLLSDSATYKKIDEKVNLTKNYMDYANTYNRAAKACEDVPNIGHQYLDSIMAAQKANLMAEMRTLEFVQAYVDQLSLIVSLLDRQVVYADPNAKDYTLFIKSANAESVDGWNVQKGNGDGPVKSGQYYDEKQNYFDSWNSNGLTNYLLSQDIVGLPNGVYTLGVYTRTPSEGAYVFYATADTTFVEIPMNQHFDETGDSMITVSDKYGPMWEEANVKINGADGQPAIAEDDPLYTYYQTIYNANGGVGRGWQHQEFTGITVADHKLTIGTMTGTEASKTEKVFAGNWYSVGGWTLTLEQMGNNDGWEGPVADALASGIETVSVKPVIEGIYSLTGVRTNRLQRGLNIVVRNGKTMKILVK